VRSRCQELYELANKIFREVAIGRIEAMILSILQQIAATPSFEDEDSESEAKADRRDLIDYYYSSENDSDCGTSKGGEYKTLNDRYRRIEIKLANRRKVLPDGYISNSGFWRSLTAFILDHVESGLFACQETLKSRTRSLLVRIRTMSKFPHHDGAFSATCKSAEPYARGSP
jgi:hypothetical protein